MKVKANVSFTGSINMTAGEVREYSESAVLTDLMNAGYVSLVGSVMTENQKESEESKKGKKTGKAAKKENEDIAVNK